MADNMKQIFAEVKYSVPVARFMHYRDYLGNFYKEVKARCAPYSYIKFANDLGFGGNNNLFRLVIKGQRSLSMKAGKRIAESISLSSAEAKYWLALIAYCNATRPGDIERTTRNMMRWKTKLLPETVDATRLEYFGEWYHSVIREMAGRPDFQLDPKWIQSELMFPVPLGEIKRSLELLTKLGLVYFDARLGRYTRSDEQLDSGRDARGIAFVKYHEKMITQAKNAISRVKKGRREIAGATMLLSKKSIEVIKEKIHSLLDEAIDLETKDEDSTREVVQLNMQLFPFTAEKSQQQKEM